MPRCEFFLDGIAAYRRSSFFEVKFTGNAYDICISLIHNDPKPGMAIAQFAMPMDHFCDYVFTPSKTTPKKGDTKSSFYTNTELDSEVDEHGNKYYTSELSQFNILGKLKIAPDKRGQITFTFTVQGYTDAVFYLHEFSIKEMIESFKKGSK